MSDAWPKATGRIADPAPKGRTGTRVPQRWPSSALQERGQERIVKLYGWRPPKAVTLVAQLINPLLVPISNSDCYALD